MKRLFNSIKIRKKKTEINQKNQKINVMNYRISYKVNKI